jgi:hypothetical protein
VFIGETRDSRAFHGIRIKIKLHFSVDISYPYVENHFAIQQRWKMAMQVICIAVLVRQERGRQSLVWQIKLSVRNVQQHCVSHRAKLRPRLSEDTE